MNFASSIRQWREGRKRREFVSNGRKPWSRGYLEYKQGEIERVLRERGFQPGELPAGYGFRIDERIVEYPWLFSLLPSGPGTLLDAGSALNFNFFLKHPSLASKKMHICTLAPESECFWNQGISYLFDDLRRLPYRDGWFDWVVSLSTLEHVGMDNTLLYTGDSTKKERQPRDCLNAVVELKRVLKPGGILYASVPFGRAQNHGWFQIFDQAGIEELIAAFAPRTTSVEYFLYHADGWHRSDAVDSAGATYFDMRQAKGYDPDFAAAARAVCCLELVV